MKNPAIDKTVEDAYDRLGARVTNPTLKNSVLTGRTPSPAISRYAAMNPHEYFAESFSAYIHERNELQAHDPNGYKMVTDVLTLHGIKP